LYGVGSIIKEQKKIWIRVVKERKQGKLANELLINVFGKLECNQASKKTFILEKGL
jgi:hypothetical protein